MKIRRCVRDIHGALTDPKLDEIRVVYPGERRYRLAKKVEVVPLAGLVDAM
jgi:hypothetical protein